MQAVVTVSGAPLVPEPAAERGFKIERTYYTLDGKPADPTKAKQNDRFAVVLKITEPQPQFGRIIVADYLPKREEGTLFPLAQIIVELVVTDNDRSKSEQAMDSGNAVFEKAAHDQRAEVW